MPCEDFEGNSAFRSKEIRKNEAITAYEVIGAELEILDLDPYDFTFDSNIQEII